MPYGKQFDRSNGGNSYGYNRGEKREFPNSGAMFNRQKRSPASPDMTGQFTLNDDVLSYVMQQAQAGLPVELEVKGWHKASQKGPFVSLSVDIPFQVREPEKYAANQQAKQGGGGNYRQQFPAGNQRDYKEQGNFAYGGQAGSYAQSREVGQPNQQPNARGSNPYAAARGGGGQPNWSRELNDEIPFGNSQRDKPPFQ